MTDERKQEFTLRITQANSTGLTVILYEMLLTYIDEAKAACENGDKDALKASIRAARGSLEELMNSLNPTYEIAGNLMSLYLYVNRELLQSQIKKDAERLVRAEAVIRPLYEAYRTISAQDDSAPLMQNTQTVIAGMTYGRDCLNESMEDQGASRGYFV